MTKVSIRCVLCPVDFSDFSDDAYCIALSLASRYKANLLLQHVVELWQAPAASFSASASLYEDDRRERITAGQCELKEFLNRASRCATEPESIVSEGGFARDMILSLARERNVDVIVMGTHGRRGIDRLMLGSVTEKVLRGAQCAVLAVPGKERQLGREVRQSAFQPRAILLCTDFSEHAQKALAYALSLAKEYGALLTLVHILESGAKSDITVHDAFTQAENDLERLVSSEERASVQVDSVVRAGSAYREIVQLATARQADLVVMAVRGRGALDLAVFGSTTYRVIQLGSCPVLAVHS